MLFPFTGLTIYILEVMSEIWSDEVEEIAFITPAWKSLSILPSLLDLLIGDPIFIPSRQLVGPLPTRPPFNIMVWPISVCSAKRMSY